MTVVELWVQAEVLPVRLRLVPAAGTGHLETLTLRAIASGVDDVDDLADIFGISPRMMLDLVGDLWREDRVAIVSGTERETVVATTKAREELKKLDRHGSLPSGYRVSDSGQVLLEQLTGRILPLRAGRPRADDRSMVVPTMPDGPTRATVDRNELVSAVIRGMEDRRSSRRADAYEGMRVVDVMLIPQTGSTTAASRYIPMTVQANLTAGDELVVSVDDVDLPLAIRELATRRLDALLSSDPRPPLANHLKSLATRGHFQPKDITRVLAQLRRGVDALPECPPANRQRSHDQLAAQANEVYQHVDSMARQEMDAQLVQDQGEHRDAIVSLIEDARRQLVLAVPWVKEAGLRPYLGALTQAVRRGVKVFLLWGIRETNETLDAPVRSQLLSLQREADHAGNGGDVYVPEAPSYLHAKVIVADDQRALVTSRNFFGTGNSKELGVVLKAPAGQPSPLIESLLEWAHRVIPSAALAEQIARGHKAFDTPDYRSELPPLELPQLTEPLQNAPDGSALTLSWRESWRAVVADLGRLLQRERPVVSLVTDGYHRTLMHRALEEAQHRVVIASDGFSTNAVSTGVVAAARQAAARGVLVTVVYGRGRDNGAAERVAELKKVESGSSAPVVRQVTNQHVKVLLQDNTVLIGSFNYLSLDSSWRRGRSTGEVSVLIESAPVSDAVAALLQRSLGEPEPTTAAVPVLVTEELAPAVPVALAAKRVLETLAEASDCSDPGAVADILIRSGSPGEAVELLGSFSSDGDVERALAALVCAWRAPDESWYGWLRQLTRAAWRRGAWWAAAQLRAELPLDEAPSPQLAAAAAAGPSELAGLLPRLLSDQALPAAERDAIGLLGVVQLLRSGEQGLEEPLRRWEGICDNAIQAPVHTVLEGAARYGALPRAELVEIARNSEASVRLDTRWDTLEHAAGELRRYKPNTPPGDKLLASLFGPDHPDSAARTGEMSELGNIIAERDAAALARWSDHYREQDDARWVDRASSRAHIRPIDGSQRSSFIHKHAAIWQAAEDVRTAAQDVGSVAGLDPSQLDMIATVEAQLGATRDAMDSGWAADLVRIQVDRLLAEIRGLYTPPVPGAVAEDWRFPRTARARHLAEALTGGPGVRLLAADICSAWSPPQALDWLVQQGEFGLADTVLSQMQDARLLTAADADVLASKIEHGRATCLAEAGDEWFTLRAQADCAGVPMPVEWQHWQGRRTVTRREETRTALTRAKDEIAKAVDSLRKQLEWAFTCRRDALTPELAERITRLINVGELAAARMALEHDDGAGAMPVIDRGRPWPYRHMTLATAVYQLSQEEHHYPLVPEFVTPAEDTDGQRLKDALAALLQPDEEAVLSYADAVQLLVTDPMVPRRLHRVTPSPTVLSGTDGGTADTAAVGLDLVPPVEACYLFAMVLPPHPTLPSLRWTGREVLVAIGDEAVEGTLFRLSLRMSSHAGDESVVDVSSVLSLLAADGDHAASQQLRGIRLLRSICSGLPLRAIVDAESIGPLDSADARVRLWTLLHVLGFEVDDIARASLVAVAGDHPYLLWHLIDLALRDRRRPDVDSAQLSARWDTARLLARDDFDQVVRKAVRDDVPGAQERAVLAALALMSPEDQAVPEDIVAYVASGARSHADQETLSRVVDSATVERHLQALQAKRYVTVDADGRARFPESVVGRSLVRFEAAQWLEETASELLKQESDPEQALIRELSHSLVQSYRLVGNDPQALGPRDMLDPDVPCWASRWAAMVVSRSGIQDLYSEESISVAVDPGTDLWVRGPSVAFALVLDSLIHNARTAVGKRLRTVSDPGRILVSLQAEAELVRIEVSDNGPGMPDDVLAALRSGDLVLNEERGYGLSGVTRRIAEQGWRLDVDRHPHLGGARVVVRIPGIAAPA
jgi:signal transduction histidine kinase/phosphatidylserine/phosphatidylglycerophosphate/cardiolipin synthase-like enzyme